MLKALIIDHDQDRRLALIAQLQTMAIEAHTPQTLSRLDDANLLILLDVQHPLTHELITAAIYHRNKIVLSNAATLLNVKDAMNCFYLTQDETRIVPLVARIQHLIKDRHTSYLLPVANDPQTKGMLEIAAKTAKSNATVLITGETGVGKEILAHYVHLHSPVSSGPFVSVNCAALPDNMVEAILFGYEKGAFTSAVSAYAGKFEQAQHGTLLLDEIAEIPLELQAKLLRALQEREIERLGAKKTIPIQVRIIAATNRDLYQQVRAGNFRSDLYYRLNVIPIHCLPLRDRVLDILPLVDYFMRYHALLLNRGVPHLTDDLKTKLLQYAWPGNIREMENLIQRALILSDHDYLDVDDVHFNQDGLGDNAQSNIVDAFDRFRSKIAAHEAKMILEALKQTNGCRQVAAKQLNMSPRTLRYKIAKLKAMGLDVP